MLLIRDDQFDVRRNVAVGALAPLATSLAAELDPLLTRDLHIPTEKAVLSRTGGRCERDGTPLEFDPFSPQAHRCPRCGTVFTGEAHDRAWIYPYQLWIAERGVHAALLWRLGGHERFHALATRILSRYADTYTTYPNRDNVLGPTRLFFSTYLESIWLLQICVATDLLRAGGDDAIAAQVCERIVVPSREIIAQYNEGHSNRQVWNNAALMAASLLTNERAATERLVHDRSGVLEHIDQCLLRDGSWYEGENYHLFAHRGLWYAVTMAENAGMVLPDAARERFQRGFATPFATALPDLTLPSRKDSQYAISLRQSRFAELCELGLARADDPELASALARLYADDIPRGDTGRARTSADVERNGPATSLTRADLSWRSLLHALPALPPLVHGSPHSVHLDGQGVSVFRRDQGRVYVALDWGQTGGGHGHPDRLNVMFSDGPVRWLDDLGTGSYVDPSLHWYRSTLAHNAPLANGHSQARRAGRVLAYDERGGVGWILAEVSGIAPHVTVQRALLLTPDYFVDEITWHAPSGTRIELPVHFGGEADVAFTTATLDGGAGLEDGFEFAHAVTSVALAACTPFSMSSRRDGREARAWLCASLDAQLFHASAPGQPANTTRQFYVVRSVGARGAVRSVWAWSNRVKDVQFDGDHVKIALGDETHEHWRTAEYWQMELAVGGAKSGIELYGWTPAPGVSELISRAQQTRMPIEVGRDGAPTTILLGESHYRRSEHQWADAGRPTAEVSIAMLHEALVVDVRVPTANPVFVHANAENPYDNESPDINGHGVQIYLRTPSDGGAWMVVPDTDRHEPRIRTLSGWGSLGVTASAWTRTAEGFEIRVAIALTPADLLSGATLALDVIVNETEPGRTRRRGQLVLSGGHGEFVYLRGDRHDPDALVPVAITA